MTMWLNQIVVASLFLVAPPPIELSPEPAPAKSKVELLMEARLKRGLPSVVYEKVKDYKYKFQNIREDGKTIDVFATNTMKFEKDGSALVGSFYCVHIRNPGEKNEYRHYITCLGGETRFTFDRKVKSLSEIRKARLKMTNGNLVTTEY